MTQEGTEDSLFVLDNYLVPAAGAGGIGDLAVDRNHRADGAEANDAPNLLSGRTLNLRLEDMAELRRQGIAIDDNKDPAAENVPRQGDTTDVTGNCIREGIICSHKDVNLKKIL